MAVDPAIAAIFGQPPAGTDLSSQSVTSSNAASTVFFVVAALCVALRFYVRVRNDTVGRDDYTVVAGLISTAALLVTTILAGQYGAGQHVWMTTLPRFVILLKIVYAEPFVYAVAVTTTKISILLLYRRLFHAGLSSTNRLYAATYWTATALTSCYPVVIFVVMALACRPVRYYWAQYEDLGEAGAGGGGTCIDVSLFYLVFGIVNMVIDIIILLSPIPRIVALQLNKRRKVSVIGIMLLGSFVCVASMFRIYYLDRLEKSVDVTWWMGPGMAWSSIEPSVAIISACLPTFAPLLRMGSGTSQTARSRSSRREVVGSSSSGGGGGGYYLDYDRSPGSPRRYGVHRATATRGAAAVLKGEDDEVELTRAGRGCRDRDRCSTSNLSSLHGGVGPGGIVVDTEVRVSSDEGPL